MRHTARFLAAEELFVKAGWQQAGATPVEHYRTGSHENPIYGGIGGKAVTVGGRRRMRLPETEHFATIGPRTVCFYVVVNKQAGEFVSCPTKDLDAIAAAIAARG